MAWAVHLPNAALLTLAPAHFWLVVEEEADTVRGPELNWGPRQRCQGRVPYINPLICLLMCTNNGHLSFLLTLCIDIIAVPCYSV